MCEDDHGALLPASNILAVSPSSSAPPIPTSSTPTLQVPRNPRNPKNTKRSTAGVLFEQAQALKESEAKKDEAANKELADMFGVTPEELDAQREQYKKLEQQQSLNDQKSELYPAVSGSGVSGEGQEHVAVSQGGAVIQEYHQPLVNRRHAIDWQCSEEPQPAQPIPPRPVSHNLEVGSAVELVDPPGYGIIRWIGSFPGVDENIAGVELVSCVVCCYHC